MEWRCESCKWAIEYLNAKGEHLRYECHQSPPTVIADFDVKLPVIYRPITVYPVVPPGDWCAQFEEEASDEG